MGPRDAHAARLRVQPGRERLAKRVDPATDAVLRLQHGHPVALALELEGRHEARQPGADDDDAPGGLVASLEALLGGLEQLRVDRRRVRGQLVRRDLAGSERLLLQGRDGPALALGHACSPAAGSASRSPVWIA